MTGSPGRGAGVDAKLTYEESKRLAQDQDPSVRVKLAKREDIRPEVLYFLAEDSSSEVRRHTAANRKTPGQADLILASDDDEAVRRQLAEKVAHLLPELDADAQAKAQQYVIEVIEVLAQDQAARVRQVMAETLKDVTSVPPRVIQRLARDAEVMVACPVLEFSPLLSDRDLLEIIETGAVIGKLQAISRRKGVGEEVADAVVATDDNAAIAALLENKSAQIREETLDGLVEAAQEVTAWQEPLVRRPKLSVRAMQKLAGFVAFSLLDRLEGRNDLDKATAKIVAEEVSRRLEDNEKQATEKAPEAVENRAKQMMANGTLEEDELTRALNGGDRDLVRHGLALRAGMPLDLVDHILSSHSAKGVTALAWKAGFSMRFATQLQLRMGGIPPNQVLKPRDGTDFPLGPDELAWQLDFFQSLSA